MGRKGRRIPILPVQTENTKYLSKIFMQIPCHLTDLHASSETALLLALDKEIGFFLNQCSLKNPASQHSVKKLYSWIWIYLRKKSLILEIVEAEFPDFGDQRSA